MSKITPCLWFDTEGEQAAELYTSVFPNSRILDIARYGEAGPRDAGTVMTVSFELDGASQEEVDHYWSRLSGDGEEGPCGWLKDRFGLSWQVVARRRRELLGDSDRERSQRAMAAMLKMR